MVVGVSPMRYGVKSAKNYSVEKVSFELKKFTQTKIHN